jgi:hydrogenase expression/formation protein HypD
MKYIDGFRNPAAAARLRHDMHALAGLLPDKGRPFHIMEVCGSHTMAIARYGIRDLLPPGIRLISGPGCPVCVTPPGYIDAAICLAERGVTVATFGDMLPVPGSQRSLAQCRAQGGRVEVCYGPAAAIDLALQEPDREVVFLAIGFETTTAPVISLVDTACRREISNLSLLTAFKLVPPALQALMTDPDVTIDAFLCPAHVSAIIGSRAYEPFAGPAGVPCVIAGFEPLDILYGIEGILRQFADGVATVDNQYNRVVRPGGNKRAQHLMSTYLEPVDAAWRGIGVLPASGLGLRPAYRQYDAAARYGLTVDYGKEAAGCVCGEVIKGKCLPPDCPLFGSACTPDRPVGPCMVSTEGTCSAYHKYSR